MEFLRFGSSIPGSYWGCCAVCIIQNFKVDPDAKASIQLVSGDGGGPILEDNKMLFAGPTYRDIFKQRLRIGTFSNTDMPNHGFLAVLTAQQIRSGYGAAWLKILKEEGFEFLRAVDNSVYTGPEILPETVKKGENKVSSHVNYVFGLFRNIGKGSLEDQFTPPKEWTDLPQVVPEAYQGTPPDQRAELTKAIRSVHRELWLKNEPTCLLTEEEVVKAGAPVTLAGLRSQYPPERKDIRENKLNRAAKLVTTTTTSFPSPAAPVEKMAAA